MIPMREKVVFGTEKSCFERLKFYKNIFMGDKKRVFGYDPETNVQSFQWKSANSPRPKLLPGPVKH